MVCRTTMTMGFVAAAAATATAGSRRNCCAAMVSAFSTSRSTSRSASSSSLPAALNFHSPSDSSSSSSSTSNSVVHQFHRRRAMSGSSSVLLTQCRMSTTSSDEKEAVAAAIAAKGDEIRSLKEGGISKADLAPHVEELLALKAKLDPPPSAAASAAPEKKKKEKKPAGSSTQQQPSHVSDYSEANIGATAAASSSSYVVDTDAPRRVKTADASKLEDGTLASVKGWVRTVRKQKTLAFVEVNDGSNLAGLQCVLNFDDLADDQTRDEIEKLTTGCSVDVVGKIVPSQGGKQSHELSATKLRVVGPCPTDSYPLAKKRHSLEYLRTIAHLRPRTNTLAAVARVRSKLAGAVHAFFQNEGFKYVQTPLITASDCEGAGEMFRVTTLDTDDLDSIPRATDDEGNALSSADYAEDFFGKSAYLTVSGQLGGETHACSLGDVYTFGPTFRAENSQTARHLAEFWMVEPEMAFADLTSAMDNAEAMLKSAVSAVLADETCTDDLAFFANFYEKGLRARLDTVVNKPFGRVSYRDAIGYLQEEIAKDPSKWQFPDVEFGTDLATEHERWLAEVKFESAVFVYNYPKDIKAFYMRDNDDDGGETVNAMDLLVPGVGELVGGSQREERLDVLVEKMKKLDLDPEDYWWYLDLRRYGSVPHAGYGLGFERLVTYVCGIENIRDAIAFPRYPGNAEF